MLDNRHILYFSINFYQKVEKIKDSTGTNYVYLQNNEMKFITIDVSEYNIEKKVEWYFSKGQMIYTEQIWTDIVTKKVVDNQKCYLANHHLIAWIKLDKGSVDKTSAEFKEVDTKLAEYAVKLLKQNNK